MLKDTFREAAVLYCSLHLDYELYLKNTCKNYALTQSHLLLAIGS